MLTANDEAVAPAWLDTAPKVWGLGNSSSIESSYSTTGEPSLLNNLKQVKNLYSDIPVLILELDDHLLRDLGQQNTHLTTGLLSP